MGWVFFRGFFLAYQPPFRRHGVGGEAPDYQRPRVGIWSLQLTAPLLAVPILLRAPDPDAQLDLQTGLDEIA